MKALLKKDADASKLERHCSTQKVYVYVDGTDFVNLVHPAEASKAGAL